LATSEKTYSRLFYYREGKLARQSFFAHPDSIDIFAPQSYEINKSGSLIGNVDAKLLTFAAKNGIKVMPLVTNKGFSKEAYEIILYNQTVQDSAIKSLVAEAKKKGYWGWQIDFEQMDVSNRDEFSAFIKNTGAAMMESGLAFSVAVMAHVSENPDDYPKNLWQRILGVYDYTALSASSDFLSVMSYDDPTSKGPVAGYSWYNKVIEYSIAHVPREKISIGIPLYYWLWNDTTGKLVGIGGNEGIQNVFQKHKVNVTYNTNEHAMVLNFSKNAKRYALWYENSQTVPKKLTFITENGLHGFSAWALGLEHPSIHNVVGKK
jgi:spore germination protein YaaH